MNRKLKIYFAGAIRGGRKFQAEYEQLIEHLKSYGTVLSEHVGLENVTTDGEQNLDDFTIYKRDVDWIRSADVIIAEVSQPSLGVGYELGLAESLNKKILCLCHKDAKAGLSAMITGNKNLTVVYYSNVSELELTFADFLA